MSGQQAQQQRKPWHQSRMMWAGILGAILGIVMASIDPERLGDIGALFLVAGGVCIVLWVLRRFFTAR